MSMRSKLRTSSEICADCSAPGPQWASINRGVLICDECCGVHRSLGRHVSQVRHLRLASWNSALLAMVRALVSNHANLIWEHSLPDPSQPKAGFRKPNPKDPVHPIKSNFIKAKYEMLDFAHRLPSTDLSISALSKQLYAAVKTANLETSLRLMSLGALPNYFHPEKGNTPLHAAAQAGQAAQIELLTVWGADPSALDINGNTAADIARLASLEEIELRLTELMYELTDRLTFYLCGRRPDHRVGINYLIPSLADTCRLPNAKSQAKDARSKLQMLNNRLFEELASDVYDEVDRRENDAVWLTTQHHRKLVADQTAIPFLPVNPSFTSTRNQGRQKLARFNALEFATMIVDLLHDARRRELDSAGGELTSGIVELPPQAKQSLDHDYDEVGSDDDMQSMDLTPPKEKHSKGRHSNLAETEKRIDSVCEDLNKMRESHSCRSNNAHVPITKTTSEPVSIEQQRRAKRHEKSDKRSSGNVSLDEYNSMKKDLEKSEVKMSELQRLNKSMKEEVNLLRTMVQRLMQENVDLRSHTDTHAGKDTTELGKKSPDLDTDDKSDSDHVALEDITPHPQPGLNRLSIDMATPVSSVSSTDTRRYNPYDNVQEIADELNMLTNSESRMREQAHNSSSLDNIASSEDSNAFGTEDDTPDISQNGEPNQEDIVMATEQITKKIQELLVCAQSGRHSRYIPSSSNISAAVNHMANLFPKHPGPEGVRSALRLMITSAARLQVECRSSVLPDRTIDTALLTQQVIQCAYDIAKAAKNLVSTYSGEEE